jgi:hypothetical protein
VHEQKWRLMPIDRTRIRFPAKDPEVDSVDDPDPLIYRLNLLAHVLSRDHAIPRGKSASRLRPQPPAEERSRGAGHLETR